MRHFFGLIVGAFFIFQQLAFTSMASAAPRKAVPAAKSDMSRESLMIELTGRDEAQISDLDLYSEIVAAYQAQDEIGLKSRLQRFMTKHPHSPFADNALYIAGRFALDTRNYSEAIKHFQRISTEYPRSNRLVASQFAKAMAYKKMKLEGQARNVFRDIIKRFPGSPESYRASSELRLLN